MSRDEELPRTREEFAELFRVYPRFRRIRDRIWVLDLNPHDSLVLRDFDPDGPIDVAKLPMAPDSDELICLAIAMKKREETKKSRD